MEVAKQVHIDRLMRFYVELGSQGLAWEEVAAEEAEAQRHLLSAGPARLSVPHLRQIILAWDRWVEAKPSKAALYRPSATHLGLFLQGEAKRGPTVAASRMRGFKWLHANLGMPFPIGSPIIKDFTRAAEGHVSKQALSLSLGELVNILRMAKQEVGTNCIPAKLVTLVCVTCL